MTEVSHRVSIGAASEGAASDVFVDGVLLLYHRPTLRKGAATIVENIEAFGQHSQYKIFAYNTEYGFPSGLSRVRFSSIVFHYSLFGGAQYFLDDRFRSYLEKCRTTYKVAFFQDEYRYCRKRFGFINHYQIDCVYTLVEPQYFSATYEKCLQVPKLISHLPGYVSDSLIDAAKRLTKPDEDRTIDIGYRARPLEFYMGKGAQEKCAIAEGFCARADGLNLKLDVECNERKRIYGEGWYRFTANCRGFLGVEAGVSVFDLDDQVRTECERLLAENPRVTFQEISDRLLYQWEDRICYRTISPRHFEAAAFRVCQILFEGKYSGILEPMVHYIPLKKDFSNFNEIIRLFSDPALRRELTENAHRDLIASGRYSYQRFIETFDAELMKVGLKPEPAANEEQLTALLESGSLFRKVRTALLGLRFYSNVLPNPIKKLLRPVATRALYPTAGIDKEQ